jgi:hypothetical protein
MVICLSTMPKLEEIYLSFQSRLAPHWQYPMSQLPPPPIRVVLPALTIFWFLGRSEYIEDLVHRIDVPLICFVGITFFYQPTFRVSQLHDFIARTQEAEPCNRIAAEFDQEGTYFKLTGMIESLEFGVLCADFRLSTFISRSDLQLVIASFLYLERLQICECSYESDSDRRF